MSDYGNPPQDPNAQPNPYGGQPNPYGQQPAYGQVAYGQPPYGGAAAVSYASWLQRVGASLIDGLLHSLAGFPLWIGYGMLVSSATTTTNADGTSTVHFSGGAGATGLILLGALTSLAFLVWNVFIKQGRTGYTVGKGVLGIKLVSERTGQPIGAGMAFIRYLCHFVDSILCGLGYLWPLWDRKRQTFADKIMSTLVINQPKG